MTDVLESGRDPWQRPRWILPLLVVLALIGGVAWVVLDRREAGATAERRDRPYRLALARLSAGTGYPTASELSLGVEVDPQTEPGEATLRVIAIALPGFEGRVRGRVTNQYIGTGPGPELKDIKPFVQDLNHMRLTLTIDPPAVCGHPLPGPPPPLLLTVELPSGRQVTQRVPIFGPYFHSTDGRRVNDLDWTHAMAEAACRPGGS